MGPSQMISSIKRTSCWIALLLGGLATAQSATIPLYINSTPLSSPPTPAPIIDARVWVNRALFDITSLTSIPFEAYNNVLFTNSAAVTIPMVFDPGVRFQRNAGGQRLWMDTWVNRGTIVTDHNNSFFSGFFISDSRASILQVAATNIIAKGPLFSGSHGLIRLEGKNIDVSRNALRTGSSLAGSQFGGGFLLGSSNYVNDVGVTDLYWGGGQGDALAADRRRAMNVTSNSSGPSFLLPEPVSTSHDIIEPSTLSGRFFTNTTVVPNSFFSAGTNFFFNPNVIGYAAIANQSVLSATSRVVQVIYYPTNDSDPEFTTEARFYRGFGNAATAAVGFHASEFDIATQTTVTNSVYLVDALATTTNFFFARNLTYNTRRPNTFEVSRFVPTEYAFGGTGNVAFSSDLIYTTNSTLNSVTNRYAAYAAQVDLLSSSPSGSVPYNVTNAPGRIEIIGDQVNLDQTRIRAESSVIIKANNLISNNLAEIDAPLINFDARSVQPVLVISNLAPQFVRRFGGTVRAWSAVWENFEPSGTGTNATTNSVTFHVLIVESQLRSQVPVTVNEFAARATNVVIADTLNISSSFAVEGSSFHLLGGLTLPLGAGLGASNLVNVRNFTNDGIINLTGSSIFGTDRVLSYSNYVNRGTNFASSHEIRTRHFENSGSLLANGGTFLLDSVTASLVGSPLIVSNSVFSFPDFDFVNFVIFTNTFTNTLTLQTASSISGVSDVEIRSRDLVASNSYINAGTLILTVTNRLADSGLTATNFWNTTAGFHVTRLPASSDLFGTYLRSTTPKFAAVEHSWAGEDRGLDSAGFSNNLALGKLTFDGGERSLLRFSGVGSSNALYVDYIELLNSATNFNSLFAINPNLTIYFANANVPVTKLDGAAGGRFRWVSSFTGPLSSTNITYPSGSNYTFNVALVRNKDLDSDGDGIVNSDDETPVYVAESAVLSVSLAGSQDLRALLSWNALAYSSNYLEFKTTASETNWQLLTNFHMGPYTWPVTIDDPINRTGASRVYRLRVDPGPY